MQVARGEPRDERAIEHACDGAIFVQLVFDVSRRICKLEVVDASNQRLHERASAAIVRRQLMSPKDTRCDRSLLEIA
jgi:hypothetical protein